jgi:hypothetical protein
MLHYFQNLSSTYKVLFSIEMKTKKKQKNILMFGGRGWAAMRPKRGTKQRRPQMPDPAPFGAALKTRLGCSN